MNPLPNRPQQLHRRSDTAGGLKSIGSWSPASRSFFHF